MIMRDRKFKPLNALRVNQTKVSESPIKSHKWMHYLLIALLLLIFSISIVNILWKPLLWRHFEFVHYPIHSAIEVLGAIAAILVAFMPLQVLFGKYRSSYVFISTGFLVMGLLDLSHSLYETGHGFVFTHAIALLAGSVFFSLFIFSWKIDSDKVKPRLMLFAGTGTILLALLGFQNQEIFPEMLKEGVFTPAANNINLVAGLLFLISAVKLVGIYIQEKNLGVLILIFTVLSSAIVGFTFQYSAAWTDSWWLWHIIRLIAFLALLGYIFLRIQAINTERNVALQIIKEKHSNLMKSEERFRNLFSNTPVSLWEEDWTEIIEMIDQLKKEGVKDYNKYFSENSQFVKNALAKVVINNVNQATLELFEAESKDDLVKSLEVVFATEDTLPGFIGELVALAEGRQVYETEMKLNTVKGNLINTMLRMSFPQQEIQKGQVLVSIMDITELKKVQQQLKSSMENLQRSNKELEQFAYVASHDLQEPLRMVSSYTQLLERRYKDQLDERADKYIYYAVDGAKRMQNLINDLLDYSRIATRGDRFIRIDANEVVKNALKNLEARIDETGAQIKTGKLPLIKADSGQIERLFMNLIGNSLKFSKPDVKPFIEIDAKEQKDKWLFRVKDNGIGIDEKFKEKVFVIFQRLHGTTQYKGTGIGLAICKRIVQRHEGEIWFESEENRGATFFFTLNKTYIVGRE
jgi:signal transduction histidine kinase